MKRSIKDIDAAQHFVGSTADLVASSDVKDDHNTVIRVGHSQETSVH
jgi:hypothetical protein